MMGIYIVFVVAMIVAVTFCVPGSMVPGEVLSPESWCGMWYFPTVLPWVWLFPNAFFLTAPTWVSAPIMGPISIALVVAWTINAVIAYSVGRGIGKLFSK